MKALVFHAPGGLSNVTMDDMRDPGEPPAGHIRVEIQATSLNGHDYAVAMGRLPTTDGRILMTDGAGIVAALGDGVADFSIGDHVVSTFFPDWQDGAPTSTGFQHTPGDGVDGYGVMVVVRPAGWFTPAPKHWSFVETATIPTAGLTAWRAVVTEGGVKAGDSVLVLGTVGVSILAMQLATELGAQVIVTSSSEEKLERARQLGAMATINYRTCTDWGAEVRKQTGGRGVDLVVETAGPGTLAQSINATRIGGRIVLLGVLTGLAGTVPISAIIARQIRLQGITVGSRALQLEMVAALEKMAFRPVIDTTFPFVNAIDAFRFQECGAHFGKICLEL